MGPQSAMLVTSECTLFCVLPHTDGTEQSFLLWLTGHLPFALTVKNFCAGSCVHFQCSTLPSDASSYCHPSLENCQMPLLVFDFDLVLSTILKHKSASHRYQWPMFRTVLRSGWQVQPYRIVCTRFRSMGFLCLLHKQCAPCRCTWSLLWMHILRYSRHCICTLETVLSFVRIQKGQPKLFLVNSVVVHALVPVLIMWRWLWCCQVYSYWIERLGPWPWGTWQARSDAYLPQKRLTSIFASILLHRSLDCGCWWVWCQQSTALCCMECYSLSEDT